MEGKELFIHFTQSRFLLLVRGMDPAAFRLPENCRKQHVYCCAFLVFCGRLAHLYFIYFDLN